MIGVLVLSHYRLADEFVTALRHIVGETPHVRAIGLDERLRARVTLDVDENLELPIDSSAAIQTQGLLGDQYIGLEPGADEKELADRDVIKQTQSAVVLENLIGQLIFNRAADAGSANPAPAETAPKK